MGLVDVSGKAQSAILSDDALKDELLKIGQELGSEILFGAAQELRSAPSRLLGAAIAEPHAGLSDFIIKMEKGCQEKARLVESIAQVVEKWSKEVKDQMDEE